MLTALHIENYRSFAALDVGSLTRVNLFVGVNNAGKTTLLDAIDLLAYRDSPEALWRAPERRGEVSAGDPGGASGAWENLDFDLSLVLHQRALHEGLGFLIKGEISTSPAPAFVRTALSRREGNGLVLDFESDHHQKLSLEVSPHGRLVETAHRSRDQLGLTWHRVVVETDLPETRFLSTRLDDLQDVAASWEEIVLTPDEQPILAALQILEPDLERIAYVGTNVPGSHGRGFVVKMKGSDRRLPLGSLGDGMRRMLAVALQLVRSRGGYLLVDEVDAGLHHSVMASLWRLVVKTALRLDVQVFATTHSYDCVYALASLCEEESAISTEIAVHRIERSKASTVRYTAAEIAIAAEHRLEVR